MKRRHAIASLAVMMASLKMLKEANAQVQIISNDGQIVSTGDVVVRQSAAGEQYVYDAATGSWQQVVGNDLQITSTGNVTVDQAASGVQEIDYDGNPLTVICTPGEYEAIDNGIRFCRSDGCQWINFHCQRKSRCGRG